MLVGTRSIADSETLSEFLKAAGISLPAPVAKALVKGQRGTVVFDNGGSQALGTILFVSPIVNPQSGTVKVKVEIPNADGLYQSGQRCRLIPESSPAPISQAHRLDSLTTVLFNANPLLRFDGYYLLSDLLNVPNLSAQGSQYLKDKAAAWFLGHANRTPAWRGRKGVLIRTYGILALGWRIVVCVGLVVAASLLFHGAGLVLAAFAVIAWLCVPLGRAVLVWQEHVRRKPLLAFGTGLIAILLFGLGQLVWNVIPWPGVRRAEGIVEYAPLAVVRADVPGFVEEIFVEEGQIVEKGQALARLRNEDIEADCRNLEWAIQQAEIKRLKALDEDEIALSQIESQRQAALKKQLAELEEQKQRLLLRAPITGQVIARRLPWREQEYLKEGDPLLEIGDLNQKELQIAIAQIDIQTFRSSLEKPVTIRLRMGGTVQGELATLEPRATLTPPHQSLCAPYGGPLAVTATPGQSHPPEYRLLEPRLPGRVELSLEESSRLTAGQIGAVTIFEEHDTLGRIAFQRFKKWLQDHKSLVLNR